MTIATVNQLKPYRPDFLEKVIIPLPTFNDDKFSGKVFKNQNTDNEGYFDKSGQWRNYIHYSVATNKELRQPICVATNVDQSEVKKVDKKSFRTDPKIPKEFQLNKNYFGDERGDQEKIWDQGHMAMRAAMAWGSDMDEAQDASDETYYFTNACLQHKNLNQDEWLDVENWYRDNKNDQTNDQNDKISVFSGPIYNPETKITLTPKFKNGDNTGEADAVIPSAFFKVVAFIDASNSNLTTRCFILPQGEDETKDRKSEKGSVLRKKYEVSIKEVEEKTGIEFPQILHDSNSFAPTMTPTTPTTNLSSGGVFIAAALVNPVGNERENEWVSIANYSSKEIDLFGWTLSDDIKSRSPLSLSGKLLPGETQRINPLKNKDGGGGQVILRNSGGTLNLIDSDGVIVDKQTYPRSPEGEVAIFKAIE